MKGLDAQGFFIFILFESFIDQSIHMIGNSTTNVKIQMEEIIT